MDTTTLIWIIVGIVVLLIIVIVALILTACRRNTRHLEHQHARAEKLRESARETELAAREHEAEAARARADAAASAAAAENAKARAAEASIEAEGRAATIDEHRDEAESLRARQAETLRKADDVDPYVDDAGRAADPSGRQPVDMDGVAGADGRVGNADDARDANVVRDANVAPPAAADSAAGADSATRPADTGTTGTETRRDAPPPGTERV